MTKEIAPRAPGPAWFRLLGPVTAYVDGQDLDLGSKRERCLLAALLLAPGEQIPRGRLAEWVWDDIPANFVEGLYDVASDVRGRLAAVGLGGKLVSKQGWYRLDIDPQWVDIHQFTAMVNRAQTLGDERRREMLDSALKLCVGEPLAGLDGREIDGFRARLINQIRDIEVMIIQIDLRLGRNRERISDLDRLFRTAPEDMRTAGLYMYALHRAGRTVDALTVYTAHRDRLDAVGMDVGQQLKDLHVRIVRNESDLSPEADVFLGGRPASSGRSDDTDGATGQKKKPDTDPNKGGTGTPKPVHAATETVFNAPVSTSGHAVFGIHIGGAS